jgi:hypothetical protein
MAISPSSIMNVELSLWAIGRFGLGSPRVISPSIALAILRELSKVITSTNAKIEI